MKSSMFVSRVLAALIFALAAACSPTFAAPSLPAPRNAIARPDNAQMRLTWDAVSGASRYIVRRRGPQGFAVVASPREPAFIDTNWKPGQSAEYLVQAVAEKSGALSPMVRVTLPESAPQTAPTGFKAVAGDGQVTLTWDAQPGITQYNIWRLAENQPFIVIGSSKTTRYIDRDVINGVGYQYALQSRNNAGFGGVYAGAGAMPLTTVSGVRVAVSPDTLIGGETRAMLTISLDWSARGGRTMLNLSVNNPAVEVPNQVLVAANTRQITIPVMTRAVTTLTIVTVAADCNGVYGSATLILNPPLPK